MAKGGDASNRMGGPASYTGGMQSYEKPGKGKMANPPNFQQAAMATSQSSRPDWSGPTGGQSWQVDPRTGKTTMQFNTPYQSTFDALKGTTQSAAGLDPTVARDQAVNQNLNFGMSRLNPLFDQQNNTFAAQMANSGLDPGNPAFNRASRALGVNQSDMFGNVVTNAINQGNQTQQVQQQQQMIPFQQLGALTNSVMQTPYMGAPANFLGAAGMQWDAAVDKQNAEQAMKQAAWANALGLGKMVGGFAQGAASLGGGMPGLGGGKAG